MLQKWPGIFTLNRYTAVFAILGFQLLSQLFSVTSAYAIHPDVLHRINRQWGMKNEGKIKRVGLLLPRLVLRPIKSIIQGQSAKRLFKTGKAGVAFAQHRRSDSCKYADSSALNLGAVVNDVVSDVGSILKTPFYSTVRFTNRVQVCAGSCMGACILNPHHHLQIAIDGVPEDGDDKQFLNCQPVPILNNEPESVVVERIQWIIGKHRRTFTERMQAFSYNCGAHAKDKLTLAGLGYPIFPNFGIGNELGPCVDRAFLSDLKKEADESIEYFRQLIIDLEEGEKRDLDRHFTEWANQSHSADTYLQLVLSAARGKNQSNRNLISKYGSSRGTLKTYLKEERVSDPLARPRKVRSHFKKHLKKMFVGVDSEAFSWIAQEFPLAAEILTAAQRNS